MFQHIIGGDLFVVAGPCSAESEEQLRATCQALMTTGRVHLLRCGAWKPRTRPGGFEGRGEEALRWIAALKRQHPTWLFAVEVATPRHVEMARRHGMDALWIGARTTGNPFLVSELAATLREEPLPVMVKNPMSADAALWAGALERLQQAGITDVAAVHRGFSVPSPLHPEMRNDPVWRIPLELRRIMPQVPLLCDPSHLTGDKEQVATCCQTALNLGFDGLMIESHIHPEEALTDARQQLTPAKLHALLDTLHPRPSHAPTPAELTVLRERLDLIDDELLKLLAQRLNLSRHIAAVKEAHGLCTYQPARWGDKLGKLLPAASALGLEEAFAKDILERLHLESIRVQEQRRSANKSGTPKQ